MRVNALKTTERFLLFRMIRLAVVVGISMLPAALSAAQNDSKASWDQWLDSAYQLTWHDRADIAEWIDEKQVTVFDKNLDAFIRGQEARLQADPPTTAAPVLPDSALRQLAIAQMLLYLKTADPAFLEGAMRTMDVENLKSKRDLPEVAFWYHYIQAHHHMEQGRAEEFVQDVFRIWLDVVCRFEAAGDSTGRTSPATTRRGFSRSLPYLYRNLANLILQRAIVQHRLTDIDALGVLIWNLSARMPAGGYGKWIEQVCSRMGGTESDTFRLVFAVQMIEAERKRLMVEESIASGQAVAVVEPRVVDCFVHYGMLAELARTNHGRAAATIRQLRLSSYLLSRLYMQGAYDPLERHVPVLKFRKAEIGAEGRDPVDDAIHLFDRLARIQDNDQVLRTNGFLSGQTYRTVMQELWRAIMNADLDAAFYCDHRIDPGDFRSLKVNLPLLEKSLVRYLDFFKRRVRDGHRPIIPDNAYYGAVTAAELLSDSYFLSAHWEKGLKKYDLALARRIQALEIFPFDVRNYHVTARHLTELGRLEQYNRYVAAQSDRIRRSKLVQAAAVPGNPYLGDDLVRMQAAVPEIIMRAPYSMVLHQGLQQVPAELARLLPSIENAIGADVSLSGGPVAASIGRLKQRLAAPDPSSKKNIRRMIRDMDDLIERIENDVQPHPPAAEDAGLPLGEDLAGGDLHQLALELKQLREESVLLEQLPDMNALRDRLVLEFDHPMHTLLRKLYHDGASGRFHHRKLLETSRVQAGNENGR